MRDPNFFYGTPEADLLFPAPFWKFNARTGNDDIVVDPRSTPSPDTVVILLGKSGNDFLSVQDIPIVSGEFLFGGVGDDFVVISQGLGAGQTGDDLLQYNRLFDVPVDGTLKGGDGNDRLALTIVDGTGIAIGRGGDGDDALGFSVERGTGRVRLVGGDGADIFGGGGGIGRATVVDFDFTGGDRIDVPDRGRIGSEGIVQEVGGTLEDPFLLVSFEWRDQGRDFFTAYKLLGFDTPLADAAFI